MIRYAEDVPIGFKKSVLTEAEASAPLIATTLDRLLAMSAGFSLDQEEYVPTMRAG